MLIRWWVNSKQNQAITGQCDVLGHSKQRSNSFLHTATENPGKTSETTQNLAQKWKTCPNPRKHPKAIQNPGKTSENHQHPGKTRKRGGKGLSPLASFTRCCLISRSCCTWRKQRSTRSTLAKQTLPWFDPYVSLFEGALGLFYRKIKGTAPFWGTSILRHTHLTSKNVISCLIPL